ITAHLDADRTLVSSSFHYARPSCYLHSFPTRRSSDLFDPYVLVPGVAVEIAADELAIVRPLVERIGGAMSAEKAASRPDEVEQCRLLRAAHRQLAGCVEHHCGVTGEPFGGEFSHVLRRGDVELTGILSELSQDCLRQRDCIVPIA